jgi:hypothetical protein
MHHNRGPRPPHRIQTFESNGPSVKIRGNAYQVFERYIALAREAQTSGDRIGAENLYQHAEHYFRIMNAQGEGQMHGAPRPTTPADLEMGGGGGDGGVGFGNDRDLRDGEEVQVQMRPLPEPQQQSMPEPPGDDQPPPY